MMSSRLSSLQRTTLWLCLLTLLSGTSAWAQPVAEYVLKSALLFKLPQFVYRSDIDKSTPLTMCLLGQNPFGNALEKLAQAPLDGRAVRYVRLSGPAGLSACEFVFISRSEASGIEGILRRIDKPVVTVSDIEGFAHSGGMVELAVGADGSGVSILINRRAAYKQNIEFNAQLLRLAKVVGP